jgi:hypothetical protein
MQQQTRSNKKMIQPERQDTYKSRGKPHEPTVCGTCGAVFQGGRWAWAGAPAGARKVVCPACQRIADRFPAGRVELSGVFFKDHRDEILHLVRNVESNEKQERPLERVMTLTDDGERAVVTTTGIHLARRIGESLAHSYQGELGVKYAAGEDSVRVTWSR